VYTIIPVQYREGDWLGQVYTVSLPCVERRMGSLEYTREKRDLERKCQENIYI
jgi:hypothetical protein